MIPPMIQWLMRGSMFTGLLLLTFTLGCAGEYQEPATPADYASAEPPIEQPVEPVAQPVVAVDDASLATAEYEDTDPSALTEFKGELDPYGTWVNDPTYGMVWVPNQTVVGADFAPYVTGGHWAMTSGGDWLWESDYPFGWVTFHYGRWVWIPNSGWAWIAGRRYAHAWVVWRTPYDGYDYVGWAPMPPYYYWSGGVAVGFWVVPPAPYVFCHSHYIFAPHVHHHIISGHHVHEAAARTHAHAPAGGIGGGPRGGVGGPGGGGVGGGHRFASPSRGPSLDAAHIPPGSAPKSYSAPHAKALAAARPTNAGAAASRALVRPTPSGGGLGSRGAVSSPMYRGMSPGQRGYVGTGPTHAYRSPGMSSGYRSPAMSPGYRSPGMSSGYRSPAMSGYRSPGTSGFRSSPYYGPSASHATPSYRSPSHSAPTYRSPSTGSGYRPSYSAPSHGSSFRPAAPSYKPQSSGGSFHGGGSRSGGHSHGGGGRRR